MAQRKWEMPIEGVAGENRLGVIHVWMDVRSMANRKRIVPEREGLPGAGFPVEGEASMNAHLASLVDFFTSLPGSSELGLVRM
jgi:hypothetical protein